MSEEQKTDDATDAVATSNPPASHQHHIAMTEPNAMYFHQPTDANTHPLQSQPVDDFVVQSVPPTDCYGRPMAPVVDVTTAPPSSVAVADPILSSSIVTPTMMTNATVGQGTSSPGMNLGPGLAEFAVSVTAESPLGPSIAAPGAPSLAMAGGVMPLPSSLVPPVYQHHHHHHVLEPRHHELESHCGVSPSSLSKRPWTKEEDDLLLELVKKHGSKDWTNICNGIPSRNRKQCRERFKNHLDGQVKKGSWTQEEDNLIFEWQKKVGNKWSVISQYLPNRTDNAVKNRYWSATRSKERKAKKDARKRAVMIKEQQIREGMDKKQRATSGPETIMIQPHLGQQPQLSAISTSTSSETTETAVLSLAASTTPTESMHTAISASSSMVSTMVRRSANSKVAPFPQEKNQNENTLKTPCPPHSNSEEEVLAGTDGDGNGEPNGIATV